MSELNVLAIQRIELDKEDEFIAIAESFDFILETSERIDLRGFGTQRARKRYSLDQLKDTRSGGFITPQKTSVRLGQAVREHQNGQAQGQYYRLFKRAIQKLEGNGDVRKNSLTLDDRNQSVRIKTHNSMRRFVQQAADYSITTPAWLSSASFCHITSACSYGADHDDCAHTLSFFMKQGLMMYSDPKMKNGTSSEWYDATSRTFTQFATDAKKQDGDSGFNSGQGTYIYQRVTPDVTTDLTLQQYTGKVQSFSNYEWHTFIEEERRFSLESFLLPSDANRTERVLLDSRDIYPQWESAPSDVRRIEKWTKFKRYMQLLQDAEVPGLGCGYRRILYPLVLQYIEYISWCLSSWHDLEARTRQRQTQWDILPSQVDLSDPLGSALALAYGESMRDFHRYIRGVDLTQIRLLDLLQSRVPEAFDTLIEIYDLREHSTAWIYRHITQMLQLMTLIILIPGLTLRGVEFPANGQHRVHLLRFSRTASTPAIKFSEGAFLKDDGANIGDYGIDGIPMRTFIRYLARRPAGPIPEWSDRYEMMDDRDVLWGKFDLSDDEKNALLAQVSTSKTHVDLVNEEIARIKADANHRKDLLTVVSRYRDKVADLFMTGGVLFSQKYVASAGTVHICHLAMSSCLSLRVVQTYIVPIEYPTKGFIVVAYPDSYTDADRANQIIDHYVGGTHSELGRVLVLYERERVGLEHDQYSTHTRGELHAKKRYYSYGGVAGTAITIRLTNARFGTKHFFMKLGALS
nr:VP3 [Wongorr virus]